MAGSIRTVELVTAAFFVALALLLRRPSAVLFDSGGVWQRASAASSHWVSGLRRPTARQVVSAALVGCAVGAFAGGSGAVPLGLLAGVGTLALGARRVRDRDLHALHRLMAAAPPAVDLFAAGLAAGLLPIDAARVVASAFGDHQHRESGAAITEIADRFGNVADALYGGADPETAWRFLRGDAATAAVGAASLRACRTGAPAAETVAKAASDARVAAQQAVQAQIHSVAVRATAPLALCFLPAFILVGVVPTAIGLFSEIHH
jgi:hypothetical protein